MNNELKKLIEKYCMGMQPTDAQLDEIFDMAANTGATASEVSSYIEEMQNGPTREERLEAERKAKEEAERKAKEEAERKTREKAERERREREEAERRAREKAERERKEREEAERKAREKAERERKEREEAERRAREKAKRERKEREEAERKAREEAERKAEYERRMREDPAFARAERKKAKEEAKRKAKEKAERERKEKAKRRAIKRAERKEKFKRAMKRVVLPIFIVLLVVCAYVGWEFGEELGILFGSKSQMERVQDVQGKNFTVNGVTFKMVEVKGGTFEMGSESGNDEENPHSETVSNFMIGETEVTQALWEAVMENNPSQYKGKDRPVQNVSWYDCQKFAKRLSQLTGKYFRLPTEAEWEYAARGGHKSKGIYDFAGSHIPREVAWYEQGFINLPHNVKMKSPNELGVYDMCGNVEEWCEDWYDGETYSRENRYKMCRGGYYSCGEYYCSVFKRDHNSPDNRYSTCGLRLVLSEKAIDEEEKNVIETSEEPVDEEEIVIEITEETIDEEEDVNEEMSF